VIYRRAYLLDIVLTVNLYRAVRFAEGVGRHAPEVLKVLRSHGSYEEPHRHLVQLGDRFDFVILVWNL